MSVTWLQTSPLLWIFVTVGAYEVGRRLRARWPHPLMQPTLVGMVACGALIKAFGVPYADYASATWAISFLLGPATVALAVPLHRQFDRLRRYLVPMSVGLVVGALVSVCGAILVVRALGGNETLARTMAPKAATTPVSIALTERLGGIPALAAVFAILAGILGAVAAPTIFRLAKIRSAPARGLAMGAVSHGVGTSSLLREDPVAGAFSGLAMGLTALITCLVTPVLVALLL